MCDVSRSSDPVNIATAFGAGLLSFLSPCVLPLVPAFLVNIAGEAALAGTQRLRTVSHALAFVLGFGAVFTLLWIAIALVGALAGELVFWLQRIGGILLIVLGIHMLGFITNPFGAPFIAIAAGVVGPGRASAALSREAGYVNPAGGSLVVVMGLLLVSGQFAKLPQLFNFLPLLG